MGLLGSYPATLMGSKALCWSNCTGPYSPPQVFVKPKPAARYHDVCVLRTCMYRKKTRTPTLARLPSGDKEERKEAGSSHTDPH